MVSFLHDSLIGCVEGGSIPETFRFFSLEAYVVKSVSLFEFSSASDSAAYGCPVFSGGTGYDIVSVFKSAAFIAPPAACILSLLLRTICPVFSVKFFRVKLIIESTFIFLAVE